MKTKFIYMLMIAALSGCSKNDDSNPEPEPDPIPVDQRYLSEVNGDNGLALRVEYYSDKRVSKIESPQGSFQVRYEYNEEGKTSRILTTIQASTAITTFEYQNGILVGFVKDNEEFPVEYFANNNYYLFLLDEVLYEVYLNDLGEIKKIIEDPADPNEINFFYDTSKMGAFHNGSIEALNSFIALDFVYINIFSATNLTKKPSEEILAVDGNYTFENTYDADNFLTNSIRTLTTLDGDGNPQTSLAEFSYKYIQL